MRRLLLLTVLCLLTPVLGFAQTCDVSWLPVVTDANGETLADPVTLYRVYVGDSADTSIMLEATTVTPPTTSVPCVLAQVIPGRWVSVRAENAGGLSAFAIPVQDELPPVPPAAPTGVTVERNGVAG